METMSATAPTLQHSLSAVSAVQCKKDQNQNDESLLHPRRLTKSTSWFSSLTRRASRISTAPAQKRSLDFHSQSMLPSTNRQRLNKSDWDLRKTESLHLQTPLVDTCDCENVATTTSISDEGNVTTAPQKCHCCELESSGVTTPASSTGKQRGMKKYQAVIRLNNSVNTSSYSDMSTLNLTNLDESRPEIDLSYNGQPVTAYYTLDSRRTISKHQKNQDERKLLYGIKHFNLNVQKGLKILQEGGFVDETPESVAKFLFRQERLSKKQIGKYLGSHEDFNKQVLKHFVQCHQFSHLLLVQALRQFLWSFRLPGEAMQIDRVMDCFAEHYCEQNPNIFEERDTCFILSFSIIMLNTALHNPNSKMKITAEQFIKQNKGINSGKDLAPDMLEAIFRSIKEEPFKIPDETYDDLMYTFFSPEREGWLLKQGGSWKSWKRRWFVLNDRCLYYFQHTAETAPKGIIPLENVAVRALEDKDGKQFVFEIFNDSGDIVKGCKTDSSGTVVQGNHHYYRMSASSAEERDIWMQCIRDSIENNPFSKVIAEKKVAMRQKSIQMQKFPDKNFYSAQDWLNVTQ